MRDKCASCVDSGSPEWEDRWDDVGCLNGEVYGFCESEDCYGLCEYDGKCDCQCHGYESPMPIVTKPNGEDSL